MRGLLVSLVLLALGCGEIPNEPRGPYVLAVFDPAHSDVPAPNDLAMANGKVAIAPNPDAPPADNELKLGFNGKDGFSTASTAKVRFSAALSAASLKPSDACKDKPPFVVLDLGVKASGKPTPVAPIATWDACDQSLSFAMPEGYLPGHTYLFAVREGACGPRGEAGEYVAPSPAFHFLRAGKDLREHEAAIPGETPAEKKESAAKLEAVREGLVPFFQKLDAAGMPTTEVAVMWTFTATTASEAYFDPTSKRIPFPNDLLKDPATGLVSIPIGDDEKPEQKAIKQGFNTMDGFSTTAALTIDVSQPVDRKSVNKDTVRLFRRDNSEEKKDVEVSATADGKKLVIQPLTPLLPATAYVAVVAGVRDTNQQPVGAMPLASLLKLSTPLVSPDGKTNVLGQCPDTMAKLEAQRAAMAPVLDKLEATGTPRSTVAAAFTFTTLDIVKRAQALLDAPWKADLPLAVTGIDDQSPVGRGILTMPYTARIITGKLPTVSFLDPYTHAFRTSGAGEKIDVDFVLTLPTGLKKGDLVPVVVFGHGLMTERRLSLFIADRLSRSGFATLSIDLPFHGERSVCTKDSDCSAGTCQKDGSCMNGSKPGELARTWPANWSTFLLDLGKAPPTASGAAFIDVANLFGQRDHFRQAMVDLSAVTRLVRKMDWRTATNGYGLDPARIHYAGISLGGILGGALSGVDPAYGRMLLNVGGADLPDLMRESTLFGPILKSGLADKGIKEGTPEYFAFVNAARWALDEVDPVNLARLNKLWPRSYVDPMTGASVSATKKLRLQMATQDVIVPNSATLRLLDATGVSKTADFQTFIGTHGFLADCVGELIACTDGQNDMAKFLEAK